jgi:twitching motility protein PilT
MLDQTVADMIPVISQEMVMAKIDAFFKLMHEQNASDLHLLSGQPPALRIHGDIERVKYKVLATTICVPCFMRLPRKTRLSCLKKPEMSTSVMKSRDLARYRANYFMQKNGIGAVFREIPK